MKVPWSWLREFVAVDAAPEEIARRLTFSGTEMEGIERVGGGCDGIVAAEVLRVEPHPGADRLTLCRVHNGREELQVVCGAPNVAAGDKVPFAGVGVKLPSGTKIARARIRGQESFGMLCAADELGLSDDHSGLLQLPRSTLAGTPLAEVLGPPDTVFSLEVTWNRPDCLSVIGIARELAALFGVPLRVPESRLAEAGVATAEAVDVAIESPAECPRYTARVLRGVAVRPSPPWMQRRLTLCGVRPINNIVDVTNYVMLECGQPLHAFDLARLRGGRIRVRHARPGERMATLDGAERALPDGALVIADGEGAVAVAGVMGGAGSEISADTRDVLLESACFAAPGIHRTSVRLGLATESSRRFERGVDPGGAARASDRAAALMCETGGAVPAPGLTDVYPGREAARRVDLRCGRVRSLLGVGISDDAIASALETLQLTVCARDAGTCRVEIPSFRPDLRIEADLIEEVARLHGLENVPELPPACRIVPDADDRPARAAIRCRARLAGLGLSEILNYSFAPPAMLERFGFDPSVRVALPNPVSAEHSAMRCSLAPQMAETLGRNLARQIGEAALFEIGTVFVRAAAGVREETRVCIGLMGPVGRGALDWRRPAGEEELLLRLKGIVAGVARGSGDAELEASPASEPYHEAGQSVRLSRAGRELGCAGLLRADLRREWRMLGPVAVGEFSLAALAGDDAGAGTVRVPPAFPAVERDVALVVEEGVTHARVLGVIRGSAPAELTRVRLFDIFRGGNVGQGRKSLAYSLEFRSAERSLTDEEANRHHEAIKAALRAELNAEIRES